MIEFPFAEAYAVAGFSAALVAGVLQSFSEMVMDGLRRAEAPSAIRAMQQINRRVFRTVFLTLAMGLAPYMAGLAVHAWLQTDGAQRMLIVSGALVYLFGVIGVTGLGNVPMNEKLAEMLADTMEAADYWHFYVKVWTRLNHVRTVAAGLAGALFLAGALVLG